VADLHELLGRRFFFVDQSGPDVTLVAVDPIHKTVRLHAVGGDRVTLPLKHFERLIDRGGLEESDLPGFVFDRETKFEREARERKRRRAAKVADKIIHADDWADTVAELIDRAVVHPKHRHSVGIMGPNKTIVSHSKLLKGRKR